MWNPAQPLEHQSGWDEHASFMEGLVEAGFVLLGGPLADEHRVVLIFDAASEDEVRCVLGQDPWSESILTIESIDGWTIRLDARAR
jgi:hypothetical protein